MNKYNILHYSLGFPPYRTGGLTTFCLDLMIEQKRLGNNVSLLWPGRFNICKKKVSIKKNKDSFGIASYEIINPLPVPYDEGIINIEDFTKPTCIDVYYSFLNLIKPNIIHIHTFMGLHKEFLEAAHNLGIKICFTVHDFYLICPKVKLFKDKENCKTALTCKECPQCNTTALSISKIHLLQSPLYRLLKDNLFIKKLRKKHRDTYLSNINSTQKTKIIKSIPKDYIDLRAYYQNMLNYIDIVHYNSSVTKEIFSKYFVTADSRIISISHRNIIDKRSVRTFSSFLKITYLGPQSYAKGYYLLIETLDKLWIKNKSFVLNIYFEPNEVKPYMHVHQHYTYKDLENIFKETDILMAPSLWYETFGFTVLEALSFGVPVLISDNVGAKDIIPDKAGIIIPNIDSDKLLDILQYVNKDTLTEINKYIVDNVNIPTLKRVNKEIMKYIYCNY